MIIIITGHTVFPTYLDIGNLTPELATYTVDLFTSTSTSPNCCSSKED
jgi:hypothetical protein